MNKKSQKLYSTLAATALVASAVAPVASADVQTTTTALTSTNFGEDAVTNTLGTSGDTVTVKGLSSVVGTVRVYSDAKATKQIGEKSVVTADTSDVVVTIDGGFKTFKKVYVTLQKSGEKESKTFTLTVPQEKTARLEEKQVKVNNNVTLKDNLEVTGLAGKDKVVVYSDATTTTKIGTATVGAKADKATVTITKGFGELQNVYVTVTNTGKAESDRLKISVTSEDTTVITSADLAKITVSNEVKTDKVIVKDVKKGEVYKVYKEKNATVKSNLIGSVTIKKDAEQAEIKIAKSFKGIEKVYIVKQNPNAQPSGFEEFVVGDEPVSDWTSADAAKVTISNTIKKDSVKIKDAKKGDVYTVYSSEKTDDKKAKIGTVTVKKDGEAVINIAKTFKGIDVIHISRKETNKNVSGLVAVDVTPEPQTTITSADSITISNLVKNDTVVIENAKKGEVYKVYKSATSTAKADLLGSLTVKKDGKQTIKIAKEFGDLKTVYVTKQAPNEAASKPVDYVVPAEPVSELTSTDTVTITNNYNTKDVFTLTGVKAKDKVVVYSGTEVIGKATVAGKTATSVKITLSKDVTSGDTVTFKLTRQYEKESAAIEVKVGSNVSYSLESSTLKINGVKKGTGFKVYTSSTADAATVVGEAKATKDGDLTLTLKEAKAGILYYLFTQDSTPKLIGTFRHEAN